MSIHIALILDGNRRYADKNHILKFKGHESGAERFRNVLDWLDELKHENKEKYDFSELTFYVFSMQNFSRSEMEKKLLMELFSKAINEMLDDERIEKNGISVRFIGRIYLLPKNLQNLIRKIIDKTKNNSNIILNFAIAYGGQEEIIDGVNKLLKSGVNHISQDEFGKYLYTPSQPDIIIRTGNVKRTSNFMPWQTVYSEWFFLKKMWPEITKQDIKNVLDEFYLRERRYGK
jgi:tritrans,polycis-undecaprenyl-diphosphate synthase [geranylgeranyl-diphosphate specific]